MRRLALLPLFTLVVACTETDDITAPVQPDDLPTETSLAAKGPRIAVATDIEVAIRALVQELQATHGGRDVAPVRADWIAGPGAQAVGNTVFFSDVGNKQLGIEWVAGDPRRQGRSNVTYAVAPLAPVGVTVDQVMVAADRAMATWGSQTCSAGLDIVKTSISDPTADILNLGWIPLPPPILGLTIPFGWIDEDDNFTDIDRDGAIDYAFAVILYSSAFSWAIDDHVDVETIMLHEAGHALGQAHFGSLFQTLANGFYHFAPRALMNAAYTGVQQSLLGTDEAGHCSIFARWPNR
jgi:hypothetical protein